MTTTPAARDERELFESAYLKEYFYPAERWSLVPEKYRTEHADIAWRAWQARAALAESELAEVREQLRLAMDEASTLAMSMWKTFYKDSAPEFELCDNPASIISQIDNMYSRLRAKLERVKENAQRYEFIRRPNDLTILKVVERGENGSICGTHLEFAEELDAAIDAARGVEG